MGVVSELADKRYRIVEIYRGKVRSEDLVLPANRANSTKRDPWTQNT